MTDRQAIRRVLAGHLDRFEPARVHGLAAEHEGHRLAAQRIDQVLGEGGRPGAEAVAEGLRGIDRHVGNLRARRRDQAVEQRLLRLHAHVRRRHEHRHDVLVEQRVLALEGEAHQLAIDRRTDRTLQQPLRGERCRPLPALWHARPSAQPAAALDPAFEVASGRIAAHAPQHEAGRVHSGRIDARRAGRVAPRLGEREVELALHRLKQLEHLRGVPRPGELLLERGAARTGAKGFDRRFDEVVVVSLQQRRRRLGVVGRGGTMSRGAPIRTG